MEICAMCRDECLDGRGFAARVVCLLKDLDCESDERSADLCIVFLYYVSIGTRNARCTIEAPETLGSAVCISHIRSPCVPLSCMLGKW